MFERSGAQSLALHLGGLVLTAALSLAGAVWVRAQTWGRAGRTSIVLLGVRVLVSILGIGYLLGASPRRLALWRNLLLARILAVPTVWFLFAVYYTGREFWLTPSVRIALALAVVVPVGLAVTEPYHAMTPTSAAAVGSPRPEIVYIVIN